MAGLALGADLLRLSWAAGTDERHSRGPAPGSGVLVCLLHTSSADQEALSRPDALRDAGTPGARGSDARRRPVCLASTNATGCSRSPWVVPSPRKRPAGREQIYSSPASFHANQARAIADRSG